MYWNQEAYLVDKTKLGHLRMAENNNKQSKTHVD